MAKHDDIFAISIDDQDDGWVMESIEKAMPPPLSSARIPRVPMILVSDRENIDIYYKKYYVPRVVSIGPYHYDNPKLELVEKLKPLYTKKLLSNYNVGLNTLYKMLRGENMVQELRNFYEEKSTDKFSNEVFIKMMLLDGCFILYYILSIFGEKAGSCRELRSHQIVFIQQDLFLLENQIPYKVLDKVMSLIQLDENKYSKIKSFFADNILVPRAGRQKRGSFAFGNQNVFDEDDHLLHGLHSSLTQTIGLKGESETDEIISNRCTFSNVTELLDVGIMIKPSSIMSLAHVEFVEKWWKLSADLILPQITVDDSTKSILLNLIAYEMCSDDTRAWVTSYICLLDSLIDQPKDVKALRKTGVLDNTLGSDAEVAKLFNEIGTGLVPNNLTYSKAKNKIQKHYVSLRNTWFARLKHEFVKNPWSFLALVGVVDLFLSAVQTVYAVWSPNKGKGK